MATLDSLFPTCVYRDRLGGPREKPFLKDLAQACRAIAADDVAGQTWCEKHGYKGYTSYASLSDLGWRDPAFAELTQRLAPHVAAYAEALEFDLGGRALELDSIWINILEPGGAHSGHIHPQSAVSGTLYLETPRGSAPLRLEDPRLPLMMAAPPRRTRARIENRRFVSLTPSPGALFLWESWLRHEVPPNNAARERMSVSFNYRW